MLAESHLWWYFSLMQRAHLSVKVSLFADTKKYFSTIRHSIRNSLNLWSPSLFFLFFSGTWHRKQMQGRAGQNGEATKALCLHQLVLWNWLKFRFKGRPSKQFTFIGSCWTHLTTFISLLWAIQLLNCYWLCPTHQQSTAMISLYFVFKLMHGREHHKLDQYPEASNKLTDNVYRRMRVMHLL